MSNGEKTIMVIDHDLTVSKHVKELLEFMDSPCVVTAMPDDWKERLGQRRLEAMFVGPELEDDAVDELLTELETLDPNVPVVVMQEPAQ